MRYALPAFFLFAATATAQPASPIETAFHDLLPKMGVADNGVRGAAQQKWQDVCLAASAPNKDKDRLEACRLMIAHLGEKQPAATRLWLLQQLQRIGGEESVDAIALLLTDKDDEIRDAAARALATNPSKTATAKLTDALSSTKGKAKIGLLNALGHRGDCTSLAAIDKELANDTEIAVAAAQALGRIPGKWVYSLLCEQVGFKKGSVRAALCDAILVHADRMAKGKEVATAAAAYEFLSEKGETRPIRLAGLRGQIQTAGDKAGDLILKVLEGEDRGAKAVAIGQIEYLTAGALKPLAASLDKLPVPSRVAVITAIAARGDKSQLPVAMTAAKSADGEVKRAGLLALGRLGDAGAVEFLLDAMAAKDAAAGIAAESLANLPAEGVNEKLIAVLKDETTAARTIVLIDVLERRRATGAASAILKSAGHAEAGVRTAAFAALRSLAAPEHVPGMIEALLRTAKGDEREKAEFAIVAVSTPVKPDKRAEPVRAAITDANKADLLPLLGRFGGADAKKLLGDALADAGLHDAAVIGLANWPDASANDELLALAGKGKSDAEKLRALQALVRVNTVLIERTPEERLAALNVMKTAMGLAARDDERRAILAGLGNVRHIETLRFVVPYLDQAAYAQAACKGVVELAHSKMLREPNKVEFEKVLDRVIKLSKDAALVDRAKQYRDGR